jgi:hypothetical protein
VLLLDTNFLGQSVVNYTISRRVLANVILKWVSKIRQRKSIISSYVTSKTEDAMSSFALNGYSTWLPSI